MTSFVAKKGQVDRKWFVVDAAGKNLGRLCAKIAHILQGKHKPIYTPHVDTGDFVIVINAGQIAVGKRKLSNQLYFRYSGYPGGLRTETLGQKLQKNASQVIRLAVHGMVPKTRLGRQMIRKLKVYNGPEHPHEAQQPEALAL
ncbi:MAG: 50S ribosomal protein L13 [Planctomycetes bacterium]|nr:50S ribosomal protein L13 [Planctomycetota bacterium]